MLQCHGSKDDYTHTHLCTHRNRIFYMSLCIYLHTSDTHPESLSSLSLSLSNPILILNACLKCGCFTAFYSYPLSKNPVSICLSLYINKVVYSINISMVLDGSYEVRLVQFGSNLEYVQAFLDSFHFYFSSSTFIQQTPW